jgi:hypothetical protein
MKVDMGLGFEVMDATQFGAEAPVGPIAFRNFEGLKTNPQVVFLTAFLSL